MIFKPSQYVRILVLLFGAMLISAPTESLAWGSDGHAVIGQIAVEAIDSETRDWLNEILESTDHEDIRFACNWPDIVRELPQYDYSRPYHYVNLPRNASSYQQQRDCSDGNCVTERIKYFAARLAQEQLSQVERSKAFNWLCHLTGDLHQPLHAGYADDRGGNTVMVEFDQAPLRLHQVWDTAILRKFHPDWKLLATKLSSKQQLGPSWNLVDVNKWTNTSHQFVVSTVYPEGSKISKKYQRVALSIIENQLKLAGLNLASILQAIHQENVSLKPAE